MADSEAPRTTTKVGGPNKFQTGNKAGSKGAKNAKLKRAQEIMAEFDFDPLRARIVYFCELMDEANSIRDNLEAGIVTDLTGQEHAVIKFKKIYDRKKPGDGFEILDQKALVAANKRHDSVRDKADAIAASLMAYAYPQLKAMEINPGEDGSTWAAIIKTITHG
jgi:hypothetical protein